ncbi:MAG: hypothetical protein KDA37_17685 [Planctomycetales bacterium]|nr:hypothetical protein [Planctomycetales bacterium]
MDSLTQAAHTDDFPAAIAVLDSDATRLLTGHTPLEKLRSLRVSRPSSKRNIELAVWGLGTVALDTQSQPLEIEPPDKAGLVFYKVSVNAFEGKLRPWGLTNLKYSGEFIATEARMARANPRLQTK